LKWLRARPESETVQLNVDADGERQQLERNGANVDPQCGPHASLAVPNRILRVVQPHPLHALGREPLAAGDAHVPRDEDRIDHPSQRKGDVDRFPVQMKPPKERTSRMFVRLDSSADQIGDAISERQQTHRDVPQLDAATGRFAVDVEVVITTRMIHDSFLNVSEAASQGR
jgi:hypothetical protein